MRELNISKYLADAIWEIEARGYTIRASQDFSIVPEDSRLAGRSKQQPMMDVSRLDLTHSNAFWLFLEAKGEIAAVSAAKFEALGKEGFEGYLRRTSQAQYGRESDPIKSVASPIADELGGNLIYLGELTVKPEHRRKAAFIFPEYIKALQSIAALKWPSFDWMYAFIPDEDLRLSRAYGFSHSIKSAITWNDPAPHGRLDTHWIMATKANYFDHMCASAVQSS